MNALATIVEARRHVDRGVYLAAWELACRTARTVDPDVVLRVEIGDRAYAFARTPDDGQLLLEDYEEAVRVRDGVENGRVHWSEVNPRLVGPHRSEDAFESAKTRAVDAADALLAGRKP